MTCKFILDIKNITHGFSRAQGELSVLKDVNLTLTQNEIVGLLGRSGSGKSTLLRIVAGLIVPTSGSINYCGTPMHGPSQGIAMVFQSFALFPWLTVLQNVEVGLEALGIKSKERRERALAAIDLIGLDGFENAYPRELSGGMRQRVGFARALVVDPKLLLMDEPFSALDVLTAETLRTDFIELWSMKQTPIQTVLIVTHNIEEAVLMCDRILILSSNPGKVVAEIPIALSHPRDRTDPIFRQLVEDIYAKMTSGKAVDGAKRNVWTFASLLPSVSTNLMAGLIETVAASPYNGKADLPEIARSLRLEVDDLFPVAEALQNLGYLSLHEGDLILTSIAEKFAEFGTQERKQQFAKRLLRSVPLAAYIKRILDERVGHRAARLLFEEQLEPYLSDSAIKETLDAVIDWGRYAEIFSYNDQAETFSLEDVEK